MKKGVPIREVSAEVVSPHANEFARDEQLLGFLAKLMDTMFVLPGTNIRFGLDPLIGLLPGVGDSLDALISSFLIARSARYGVPRIVMARMVGAPLAT